MFGGSFWGTTGGPNEPLLGAMGERCGDGGNTVVVLPPPKDDALLLTEAPKSPPELLL